MSGYFTESNYENAVLQLLNEDLGYTYVYGPDVERDYHSPLYEDVLLPSLQRINKNLPMDALTDTAFLGGFQPRLDFLNALGRLHGVYGVF